MKLQKLIEDKEGHVAKLVFQDKNAISEVVVYKYQERKVVCFSCMSGCPVGCLFCGTGKKFIRNLTYKEMLTQIQEALKWGGDAEKIQLMSMSMGEPMLNYSVFNLARTALNLGKYDFFISTVGIDNPSAISELISLAKYKRFGLQISLHHWNEEERKKLLGSFPKLLSIEQIKTLADSFTLVSKRPTYFNYLCKEEDTRKDALEISKIVRSHHLTCSVICNTGDFVKADPKVALNFSNMIHGLVGSWSIFNPAGQDTIGGGCGQLLYVQKFLKENNLLDFS